MDIVVEFLRVVADILHYVDFSAARPADLFAVNSEAPNCGPCAFAGRDFCPYFYSAVEKMALAQRYYASA